MAEQLPLPGMPDVPEPSRPRGSTGSGVRLTRYRTQKRRLCDECVRLIHRYGQAGAPYPQAARWRRSAGDNLDFLCEQHKDSL
jgi:hypothetical protein